MGTVVGNEQCLNTHEQFYGIFCEKVISTIEKINRFFSKSQHFISMLLLHYLHFRISTGKVRSCQFLMLFSRVLNVG